ncbi:MAG: hypothetical protein JWR38_2895 [Mucilaginibacter sp.]|nr:hypothetical protein [Mucilaginibacter sp.]
MVNDQQNNRGKWLNLRLNDEEFELFKRQHKKSVFRKMSDYGRAVLLGKPVTILYRDKSMDEVLEELILLRRELNAIGNNLNQVVKQINSAHGFPDARLWMNLLTVINGKLEPSIRQIKEQMNKYADLWSQKLRAGKA